MDVSQYLEIFIDESNEHLQSLSDQLLILEKEPENSDTINEIFRAAHSLKGMAGTMGYKRMQNLTHDMENVFSEVRNGNIKVTSDMCDVLFKCLDALESYVSNIQNTQDEGTDDNEPIIKALNSFIGGNEVEEKKEASASQPAEEAAQGTTSELVFADFEMNAVNEALKKGLGVYEIVVTVDENCILKAARAFLVFKNLEGHCDVIKSEPSTQDIEDEKFEKDFTIVVVSHESLDEVISIIKSVSEIKTAEGKAITVPFQEVNDAPAEEEKKEEVKKQPAVTEPAKKEEAKKTAAASPAKKAATANNKAVSHTVRVDIDKLDVLMNLVSELIIAKNGLVSASISSDEAATTNNQKFTEQIEYLERVTTNLHESVMKVRMMPIEGVISKFPRMIRDLNKKLNKKMELYITGEETELDRTVLDEIGDPIMHLLRNSADHGLESAEVRAERGKPEVGSIYLNAFQEGNNVVIEVSDDGNDIDKLDVLMNLVSELIIAKNGLVSASISSDEAATTNNQKFTEQIEYLERVTTNLHESVMKVRMMPIEGVISKFPRMIRDLNKKLNKKMELYITGEETELDRTVLDEIGDPIMHLLRNSADHGLESAEVRAERGKPEVGSIYLNAFQEGNNVVIEVSDDGNGIDIERVKAKAVEKGTVTQEQADAMTEKEAIDLLFRPSFSTSEKITDVSGRGVGLDVVKSKIEALGGDVEVKTKYGEGSTFSIRLPLTLAIIQALMVKLGDEKYAISLGAIETIEDVPVTDIKYIHAKEVINLRGSVIPLIRLRDILDVPGEQEESDTITVVIVRKGDKLAGLVVDSLIGQMEIVIKSLGKYININIMISGATILGDGSVALIIDANTLV